MRVHPKFLHSNATSHKWVLGGNLAVPSFKTLCLYMQPYMLDWRHCLNLGFIEVKCSDLLAVCVCVFLQLLQSSWITLWMRYSLSYNFFLRHHSFLRNIYETFFLIPGLQWSYICELRYGGK